MAYLCGEAEGGGELSTYYESLCGLFSEFPGWLIGSCYGFNCKSNARLFKSNHPLTATVMIPPFGWNLLTQ